MATNQTYDITIIGGGPTGLFAAFYAGMRKASVKIIDSLPLLGGQVSMFFPDQDIYDIPGFPSITGEQFIQQMTQQANHFDHSICLNERVDEIQTLTDGTFKLVTSKSTHYSKTVVIAAGAGDFQPRKLPIEGAKQFEDKGLVYHMVDKQSYKDQVVAICGGGDAAVDWALSLEKIAKKVYLIHRRDVFRAHEYSVSLLKESTVEVLTPFTLSQLHGEDGQLEALTLKEVRGEKERTIDLNHLIVNFGFASSVQTFKNWGLETTSHQIKVNSKMETNIPGIYAAGDIAWYDGKIQLIATGFGDAPTAINHAVHYIHPTERTQPIQSTSLNLSQNRKDENERYANK